MLGQHLNPGLSQSNIALLPHDMPPTEMTWFQAFSAKWSAARHMKQHREHQHVDANYYRPPVLTSCVQPSTVSTDCTLTLGIRSAKLKEVR